VGWWKRWVHFSAIAHFQFSAIWAGVGAAGAGDRPSQIFHPKFLTAGSTHWQNKNASPAQIRASQRYRVQAAFKLYGWTEVNTLAD
jgi:hypothetical protein